MPHEGTELLRKRGYEGEKNAVILVRRYTDCGRHAFSGGSKACPSLVARFKDGKLTDV